MPHLLCSPDLAACDFCLFPMLKENFRDRKFNTDSEVISGEQGSLPKKGMIYFLL